ncbi:MAG: DNA primase [Pararhodobacter sp.]|nr:DNA primase [Pararhodobacter sp.]
MSLPPGFLEELRSRVSLAQVVGRKVSWDQRRSNPSRGDWWAPCPFHQEKTASFHVDDRKGFYYCFGCHAKGDALSFLRDSENLGFLEAVELLAREAGMAMPARDPAAAQREDRRATLVGVMEQAARFFRLQLAGGAGAGARDYLARRGLDAQAQERFGLGYAPDARQALWAHLTGAGVAPDLIVEAGLCARPDDGGAPYDRFRGRVIFPIRDARGRCIAFGGRALAEVARAKYLNSPETALFDKGRTLYNIGPAREALGKAGGQGARLVVAEGYMDVIALVLAGFEAAVAPLGTAITEDQLRLLWRLADEPVVALDGDRAGLRAGHRLAELALGMMAPGQGLRFCLLPAGQDPDDVLRAGGAPAMQAILDRALPLSEFLWQAETAGEPPASAEAIAALDARLRALAARAQAPGLRQALQGEFRNRLKRLEFELAGRRWKKSKADPGAKPTTRATPLASAADGQPVDEALREARILAMLYAHPALIARFETALLQIEPIHADHDALFARLIEAAAEAEPPDAGSLAASAGPALESLRARPYIRSMPYLRPGADIEQVALCLAEDFAILAARRSARSEIAEAMADLDSLPDEGMTWRLAQAAAALDDAGRTRFDQKGNEADDDHARLSDQLQSLIDAEIWIKKRPRR